MPLTGKRVMIVEDDLLIARELSLQLEEQGAQVVGPVVSVKGGLRLLEGQSVDAAILDAKLHDGSITPVAEWMIEHRLPFVFHTGLGLPPDLKKRYPKLPVFLKPTAPGRLIKGLIERIETQGSAAVR